MHRVYTLPSPDLQWGFCFHSETSGWALQKQIDGRRSRATGRQIQYTQSWSVSWDGAHIRISKMSCCVANGRHRVLSLMSIHRRRGYHLFLSLSESPYSPWQTEGDTPFSPNEICLDPWTLFVSLSRLLFFIFPSNAQFSLLSLSLCVYVHAHVCMDVCVWRGSVFGHVLWSGDLFSRSNKLAVN